ncbi:MAG: RIP metalloprotease RseP [Thermoleophilaceae bacterium]
MSAAVLAVLGFVALIVLHELGHFAAAKAVGMRVERFSLFFPPLIFRKKIGETEYAIGSIPAGGYVKISGMNPSEDLPDEVRTRAYHAQPVWKRVVVIFAGPAVNFLLAFVLLVVFYTLVGPRGPSNVIDRVEKGFPAASALRSGDRLVSVDGHGGDPQRLSKLIQAHRCAGTQMKGCRAATPASLVIDRRGQRLSLALRPRFDATQGIGYTRLGFGYRLGSRETVGFSRAMSASTTEFGYLTHQTILLPLKIVDPQQRKQIHGIVGSYETTRQTILHDPGDAVGILALISLSLAIINLFPFLPLDGGHIFWALVEFVRRRPVAFSTMERSGIVGFALVIMLFFIGLSNDINTLSNGGFRVR